MTNFDLTNKERKKILEFIIDKLESYYENTKSVKVTPSLNVSGIMNYVKKVDFQNPIEPIKAINDVIDGLQQFIVHTPHPKYFGLFNPRSNFPGIISDLITAVFNPQLAAWSHAPYAVEVENYLIQEFGKKFGYHPDKIDGVFATGGAEANLTALLCALNRTFPDYPKSGIFGMNKLPIIYCSAEAHHSIDKAVRTVGLGYSSIRSIKVDSNLEMDIENLISAIQQDLINGNTPLMIVGTAGTTGTGAIDNLVALKKIADDYNTWFHVDAAYGGGAILSKWLSPVLKGIEHSDSITFDAHKWMSLPMGTSIFLTSHKKILGKTFGIATDYMPKEAKGLEIVDPFTHSIQWSRRFIGLKLYLSLQIFGWEGYEQVIESQTKTGEYLMQMLLDNGWDIKNNTPLPVICFTDNNMLTNTDFTKSVAQNIINSGKAWISVYPINGISTIRACITNYCTTEKDIDGFVAELNKERKYYRRKN